MTAPTPRLVPDRPSQFDGFSAANVVRMLDEWAADQREREAWNDGDKSTYTFRAGLLQTAANRLRDAATPPAEAPAERVREVLDSIAESMRFAYLHATAIAIAPPMTAQEVERWASVCNHEPARKVLREYIQLRFNGAAAPAAPAEGCEICGGTRLVPQGVIGGKGYCKACKPPATGYTYGHCDEHKRAGGCQRHNLQCGYPDCDRQPIPHAPAKAREDKVLAMAAKWDRIADEHGVRQFTGNDHRLFANELRAALATFAEGDS